jgi:1,6-anhydro-N-acetylmuramate kinase
MSGTSMHGVDVAIIETDGQESVTLGRTGFGPVLHRPDRRLTVQIGDGPALAERLGIKVVFDFRAADVAEGGQGAPLVPIFHRALAAAAGFAEPVAFINIGGVANLSFIAPPGEDPIACDTGPGNALLDDLMLKRRGLPFDRDGAIAASGQADAAILDKASRTSFFLGTAAKIPRPERLLGHSCRSADDGRCRSDAYCLHSGKHSARVRAFASESQSRHRVRCAMPVPVSVTLSNTY